MSLPWGEFVRRLERRGIKPTDEIRISTEGRIYWRSKPGAAWKSMALPTRPSLMPGKVREIELPDEVWFKH